MVNVVFQILVIYFNLKSKWENFINYFTLHCCKLCKTAVYSTNKFIKSCTEYFINKFTKYCTEYSTNNYVVYSANKSTNNNSGKEFLEK